MSSFLSWYVLITILGWSAFPLAYRLFPALADRGYTLSRALGLLVWGYVFWLSANFGIAQNDMGGLLLALVVLIGLSAWAYFTQHEPRNTNHAPRTTHHATPNTQHATPNTQHEPRSTQLIDWLKENTKLILVIELLFFLAFGFMAFFRSANPEIVGTEKPMELMFINGIMNSPAFPPRDLWLSGYSISYYHFGYVMTAMLAKFTGVPATMAFNLMLALIFGLSAVGAHGVLYNLLVIGQRRRPEPVEGSNVEEPALSESKGQSEIVHRKSAVVNSLLGPLFLLLVSNAEGFLEVIHARGWFWRDGSNFWTWLDIPELRDVPPQIPQWTPDRFWWWWRASRVVQDYDLNGSFREAIDEFPAFSFLLGDLHPHVLAIPFFLLAIAVALNLFLGGFRGKMDFYFGQLHIGKTGFLLSAFMLGGMAFLNTWDILPVAAVVVFSYALARVRGSGWGRERLEDVVLFGVPVGIAAYVLYLPFFISFDSQAGGIVPNFMYITRGAQLWVMWGALFVPIFALLVHFARTKLPADWGRGAGIALGFLFLLAAMMMALGFLAYKLRPEIVLPILQGQGRDAGAFLADSFARRWNHIGSLLTLLALLIPALTFLFSNGKRSTDESTSHSPLSSFVLLLIALGVLLILGPDFLYLQDNFGYRINTIFKFYYQAWILLSLAAAYGTAVLLRAERRIKSEVEASRGASNILFSIIFVIVLVVGLTYPALGFPSRANNFKPPFGFTLDDFDRVRRENPDEAAAILWLRSAPDGVVAEATGNPYSSYGRISIYTGLPTILGWGNHESQWRGSDFQGMLAQRRDDVETLYVTPDWQTMRSILERYNVRYVVVGYLERASYRVNEEKFNNFLKPVFQQGNVTIYEAP